MVVKLPFSFVFIHFKYYVMTINLLERIFIKLEKNKKKHYYEDGATKNTYFCLYAFLLLNLTPHVRPTTIW